MGNRSSVWSWTLAFVVAFTLPGMAQETVLAARGPRFLAVPSGGGVPVDASNAAVLRRRLSLSLTNESIETALREIARDAGLELMYSAAMLPTGRTITLQATDITMAAALTQVLFDTGLDIVLLRSGQMGLVRRSDRSPSGAITGRVSDTKTKDGVSGVEVWLSGTKWRTSTDSVGRYRLANVEPGTYALMTRRLGYTKQSRRVTVQIEQEDTVDIVLEPAAARLNELVATATGRRRRMDIANDVTTINADSVMQVAPIRSLTDLLANRVPGLTVQRTSGAPGDPSRLRLRGASSPLRSNDPIVVVDGIRVYAEQSASRSANLAASVQNGTDMTGTAPSPLDYIDPNTIETIEVLKGPSAATLYGQDAANGVIVITTKRGKAGPTRWTANIEQGRTTIEGAYPELTFRWGHELFSGTPVNCPVDNLISSSISSSTPCQGDSIRTFQLLNDPTLTVLDRGQRTAASLGVSGGTSGLTYMVTGSYQDEVGLVKLPGYETERYQTVTGIPAPDWMQRPEHLKYWSVTSSIVARLGPNADITLTAGLSRTDQQKSSLQDQLNVLMSAYLDRSSGQYYANPNVSAAPSATADVLTNYFERATAGATAITNGLVMSYRPRPWLTLSADAGLNVDHRADGVFLPRGLVNAENGFTDTTGLVNTGQGTSVLSSMNLRANALAPIGHGFLFRFAAGANYAGSSIKDLANGTYNLAPGTSLQGTLTSFVRAAETSDATFGWYVEPSIGNNKLNFTSGLRLDGGRSYGNNVGGLQLPKFPKLGFSYLVSEEPWFPFSMLFQSLRLRLSYGRASRQPGPEDRLRLYDVPAQVFVDSQFQTGVTLKTLGNTEVRPERTAELEGGFDADLFGSRLTLGVTGYRKTTDDALLNVPVAPEIYGDGLSIVKNIGVTRNTGVSVTMDAQVIRSQPVTWSLHMFLDQRRDEVVSLGPDVPAFFTDAHAVGGIRIAPGYPLFGRWIQPAVGYSDANGDGVLQGGEIHYGDTTVYVGSQLPNFTAALSNTLSLLRGVVTVDAAFAYEDGLSQDNEVFKRMAYFTPGLQAPGTSLTQQFAVVRRDAGVQTVNTLRFQSLSVTYNAPSTLARRLGAEHLSVAVQGSNLGLWTNYNGIDPNVNAFGTGNNITDNGVLPQPRTWQFRISATY